MGVFNFTGTNTLTALITLIKNRFKTVDDKIKEIELFKFPNATIYGSPTINNGQISNFSANNYLAFPFVVDFQNRPFTLDFEITTGSEITQQHNIFDSVFGLAFAVRQSKFVVAISTNGTSWNMGEGVGTHTLSTNTTYRVRMTWNLSVFKVSYSTDGGATYIDDISKSLTAQPYPKQILIGITSDKATFFNGVINLNYASLTISDKVVWTGMDDVGLATRADVSLSNIDANGEQKIKDTVQPQLNAKQDTITSTNKLPYSLLSGTPTIPAAVTDSTVAGWGYTKVKPTSGGDITFSSTGVGTLNYPVSTSGKLPPLITAFNTEFSHNKLDFLPPECIFIEYSNDAGATWNEYSLSDGEKIKLVTAGLTTSLRNGRRFGTEKATLDDELRVTISCRRGKTAANSIYTRSIGLMINYSSNGASDATVKVEYRTIGRYLNDEDVWTSHGSNYAISGWSGWNYIPFNYSFGGTDSQTGQVAQLRLTLSIGDLNPSYSSVAQILQIHLLGYTNWSYPSTLAQSGHLYTYDYAQNAVFPKGVSAENFNGYTINKSVPSDAKFTDTVLTESDVSGWGFTKNTGTYSKPSTGIPKTDLASAVQTSLGKADTALQSFTETDPTVPAWAKEASKPTYTASEVGARPSTWTPSKSDIGLGNVGNFKAVSTVASQGLTDAEKQNARTNIGAGTYSKPSGGIPASDMTSGIQSVLERASDAITEETDPTVPSHVKSIKENDISYWNGKQNALQSGSNIKTINGQSILGSGNITVGGGGVTSYDALTNLPSINGVTLIGGKSASAFGINSIYWDEDVYTPEDANVTASEVTYGSTNVANALDNVNTALNNFSFGFTPDGKPGYRVGADSVIPFIQQFDILMIHQQNSAPRTFMWFVEDGTHIRIQSGAYYINGVAHSGEHTLTYNGLTITYDKLNDVGLAGVSFDKAAKVVRVSTTGSGWGGNGSADLPAHSLVWGSAYDASEGWYAAAVYIL